MLCELLLENRGILMKFREFHHPQSWRVAWGHFGVFTLWLGSKQHVHYTFFPNPFSEVVHNYHLVLKEYNLFIKKKPPKPDIICERYWLLIWIAHGTASQNKQCQTNKKHHPTPIDTFYPRRLPLGSQTHLNIRWWPIWLHEHSKVKGDSCPP